MSNNNKAFLKFGIFVSLLLFALVISSPSKKKFTEFISNKLIKEQQIKNTDEKIIESISIGIANILLHFVIQEDNFLFFKIFTIDLQLARAFDKKIEDIKFLGIAGQFFPISNLPENLLSSRNSNQLEPNELLDEAIIDEELIKANTNDMYFKDYRIKSTLDYQTKDFILDLFNLYSSNNEIALKKLSKISSKEFNYNALKILKEDFLSAKLKLFNQWPLRNFVLLPRSLEVSCVEASKKCSVNGTVKWAFSKTESNLEVSGISDFVYQIDLSNTTPILEGESLLLVTKHGENVLY